MPPTIAGPIARRPSLLPSPTPRALHARAHKRSDLCLHLAREVAKPTTLARHWNCAVREPHGMPTSRRQSGVRLQRTRRWSRPPRVLANGVCGCQHSDRTSAQARFHRSTPGALSLSLLFMSLSLSLSPWPSHARRSTTRPPDRLRWESFVLATLLSPAPASVCAPLSVPGHLEKRHARKVAP